jgi:hypothetical protein
VIELDLILGLGLGLRLELELGLSVLRVCGAEVVTTVGGGGGEEVVGEISTGVEVVVIGIVLGTAAETSQPDVVPHAVPSIQLMHAG